jgi:hypothetical protein
MRLSGTKTSSVNQYNGLGDQLYDLGGAKPTLDLNFSSNESLVDSVTGKTLVDHTRQSSATYVDGDGVIRTAVTNLLLQSEDFSTTWAIVRGTLTPNAITAPNGQNTANLYTADGTFLYHTALQSGATSGTATRTYSVYAKAGTGSIIQLNVTATSNAFVNFDLSTQTYGTVSIGAAVVNPSIVSVGNGWFRCSFTATGSADGFEFGPTATLADTRRQFNSISDSVYFWGAQLEESSTVGQYVKTTTAINSAPRFDHDPTIGESLGLLVEESRTNVVLQSEDFSTTWGGSNITITPDSTTAPNGTTTADTLTHVIAFSERTQTSQPFTAGSTVTVSIFAKKNTSNFFRFEIGNVVSCWFNLNTGAVGSNQAGSGNVLFSAKSIQAYPNGWYRCILTCTTTIITNVAVKLFATESDGSSSSAGSSIYFWGAQIEAGSFPTSYIPTEGSTVTRAADVASITGTNFSSWYEQSEGTFFADIVGFPISSGQFPRIFEASDDTSNNIIRSQQYGSNTVGNNVAAGGTYTMAQDGGTIAAGISGKTAFGVAENNCAIVTNGGTPSVDTTVTMPSNLNQLGILGTTGGTSTANSSISRFTYWPTRLSNDTLQTITV